MAPRVKAEQTPTEEAKIIGKKAFLQFVDDLDRQADKAKSARGKMGKMVAEKTADENLHSDALRIFRKYRKKSPASAAEFKLHFETYWSYGGLGKPEDDLIESPAQRRRQITKTDDGKVVPLKEEDAA